MTMCSLLLLIPTIHIVIGQIIPFDPYNLDNKFSMDCGSIEEQKMRILFRGQASAIYAPEVSTCRAVEFEPAMFEITDARLDPNCPIKQIPHFETYFIKLVVQQGYVRKDNDPVHLLTCNYEPGGSEMSGVKQNRDGALSKSVQLEQPPDLVNISQSRVVLEIRDTKNQLQDTTVIGTYIQLHAIFYGTVTEVSFKVWNCKALSEDDQKEYYFLVSGCGDGDVIPKTYGFRTETYTVGGAMRRARSSYFRAFTLPGVSVIKYECDYIICDDDTCDGRSCPHQKGANDSRLRRASPVQHSDATSGTELDLHEVYSKPLHVMTSLDEVYRRFGNKPDIIVYNSKTLINHETQVKSKNGHFLMWLEDTLGMSLRSFFATVVVLLLLLFLVYMCCRKPCNNIVHGKVMLPYPSKVYVVQQT